MDLSHKRKFVSNDGIDNFGLLHETIMRNVYVEREKRNKKWTFERNIIQWEKRKRQYVHKGQILFTKAFNEMSANANSLWLGLLDLVINQSGTYILYIRNQCLDWYMIDFVISSLWKVRILQTQTFVIDRIVDIAFYWIEYATQEASENGSWGMHKRDL